MNEGEFVAALRALADTPAARGLEDDAAVIDFGSESLILTHDAMVEGRHWLPGTDMADVAWKLVAVNLSDLAAKGAEPLGILLGHTLGDGDAAFLGGLEEVLAAYNVPLLGGDTVAGGGARTLGCTAIGRAVHRPVPARSGAQAGDALYLAGTIGGAMIGYNHLTAKAREGFLNDYRSYDGAIAAPFLRPVPMLEEGRALAPVVSAMMDVSDGLLLDASRMAAASAVTLDIAFDAVPFGFPLDQGHQLDIQSRNYATRAAAVRWGDDYALLFTAPANIDLPIPAARIGSVLPDQGRPLLVDGSAPSTDTPLGYQH